MNSYDEIFVSRNQLRAPYLAFQNRTGYDPLEPSTELTQALKCSPLGDHIKIFPVPLIISETEYQNKIKAGVSQRLKAIQHFFRDIALGDSKILLPGATLESMPIEKLLADRKLSIEMIRDIWSKSSQDEIRFVYGPDMIRDESGEWRIVEDNIGVIGGMSEVSEILRLFGQLTGTNDLPVINDMEKGVENFLNETGMSSSDPRVLGLLPYEDRSPDFKLLELDSTRKKDLLNQMGIRSTIVDSMIPETKSKILSGEVRALLNFSSIKWKPKKEMLMTIFKTNRIAMLESPCIKTVASKGFLPFVESMIEFYLKEDPILRASRTKILNAPELPENPERWVLKRANACEGHGVLVLGKMTAIEQTQAQILLKEWMTGDVEGSVVVQQEFIAPSTLLNHRVELRPMAYVHGFEKIYVGENVMAKVMPPSGDHRNCVTRGAYLAPVVRERI